MKCFRLALLCAILLAGGTALLCQGSLAAYSETRSFRDALEGRSMEDAISGPVDKDTSSYGDRTAAQPASASAAPSAAQSGSSSPSSGGGNYAQPAAGPMMLTIPANGNLNGQMGAAAAEAGQADDQQQQQQQRTSGSELEREAGPIGEGDSQMDGNQRRLMEQKLRATMMMMMNRNARYNSAGQMQPQQGARSGRLQTASPSAGQRGNARQQQQQQYDSQQMSDYPATDGAAKSSTAGFGEQEPATQAARGDYGKSSGDEQQQQQQQEKMAPNGGGGGDDEQSVSEEMSAKQKAMAAMLMSMSTGMKYSRGQASGATAAGNARSSMRMAKMMGQPARGAAMGGRYGDKKPGQQQPMTGYGRNASQMAQNMIMSLANKAAYMGQQQQQQQAQRQMAPPMLMNSQKAAGYGGGGGSDGGNGMPAMQMQMPTPMAAMNANEPYAARQLAPAGSGAASLRGGMRRANQRRQEKKMSPAMMNAMLNKLLSANRQQQAAANGDGGYAKQDGAAMAAAAMMMKTPAGAEMMANLMQQMNGGAGTPMPAAKREQYKRTMMAAMMQQQQEQADGYGKQTQMTDSSSGGTAGAAESGYGMAGNSGAAGAYSMPSSATTMSPPMAAMMMMSMMNKEKAQGYGQSAMDQMRAKPADYSSMGQQQQQQQQSELEQPEAGGPVTEAYGQSMGSSTEAGATKGGQAMGSAAQRPMTAMYGPPSSSTMSLMMNGARAAGPKYEPTASNGMEQQQMMTMGMADGYATGAAGSSMPLMPESPMAGAGKTRNGYAGATRQSGAASYGMPASAGTKTPAVQQQQQQTDSYGSSAMSRPMSATKSSSSADSYGADQQQQQQLDSGDQQQQQQDEYGAAPMGQAEPFAFDYKIDDNYGNNQYRKEKSDENGVVRGSYGYMDNSGLYRHVEYVADENGFRANIKSNEPGLSSEPKPQSEAANGNSNAGGQSMAMGGQSVMQNGMMSMMNAMGGAAIDDSASQQQQQQQQMMMNPAQQTQQQQQQTTMDDVKSSSSSSK